MEQILKDALPPCKESLALFSEWEKGGLLWGVPGGASLRRSQKERQAMTIRAGMWEVALGKPFPPRYLMHPGKDGGNMAIGTF